MASIYKRGRIWYISYYVNGRRIRKRVGPSKKLAELFQKEVELKIAKGELGWEEVKDPTFNEFKDKYLAYLKANIRPTTYTRYKEAIEHFLEFLERNGSISWRLSQISFQFIERYKQERIRYVKSLTVNLELKVLKALFNYAIKCRCASKNPVNEVPFFKVSQKRPRFLTKEQIRKLLNSADSLYPILYTFLKTGLRKSELVNLKWENVDFERKRILIESNKEWQTKTGNTREIPVEDDLLSLLKKLPRKSEYVFINTRNRKYQHHLTERVKRLGRRLGLENLTLHMLRHTFISHLVMSGVDLVTVKELAGHADIKTTMRYAHLAPEHLRRSIERLPY